MHTSCSGTVRATTLRCTRSEPSQVETASRQAHTSRSAAPDNVSVERWHAAAIDNGGTDNGAPGVRPEYSGHYHAAFALDPDGNNVEAVFHVPVPAVETLRRDTAGVFPNAGRRSDTHHYVPIL